MKMKRVLSSLAALGLICSLLTAPAVSGAANRAFPDITDPTTAEAAQVLQTLGIVHGDPSGAFFPNDFLSRAQFCKMAVETLGLGRQAAVFANRTIFHDVHPTHWANGYINLAAQGTGSGETAAAPIIRGDASGSFRPEDHITLAEAVTILMRLLGYGDADVGFGANWYDGYLALAKNEEVAHTVTTHPEEPITRGQAAVLFRNLLFAKLKGSTALYLSKLGGTVKTSVLVLDVAATTTDGLHAAVRTDGDLYRTGLSSLSAALNGTRCDAALDKEGRLVALLPTETDTYRRVVLGSNDADHIVTAEGQRIELKATLPVWKEGKSTTYDKVWTTLRPGTGLVLCYNGSGQNEYLYVGGTEDGDGTGVLVLKSAPSGNAFSSLSASAALYKNGMAATAGDLRQYDVGVLDKGSNVIQVSDLRLTGIYESAAPNTTAPSSIRVMGHDFPVLSGGAGDLRSFKIGDRVTLLLTHDHRVAGVVTPDAAVGTAVGTAKMTAGTSSVTLLDTDITLTGKNTLSESSAKALDGKLVQVGSGSQGYLSLTPLQKSGDVSDIDLAAGKMGARSLAANARFYDSVEGGAVLRVDREDIVQSRIPASVISFVALDYAGRVSTVVMNNVTGDCYHYGYISYQNETVDDYDLSGNAMPYQKRTVSVRQGDAQGKEVTVAQCSTLDTFLSGTPGGLAVNTSGKLAGSVALEQIRALTRIAFDTEKLTLTTTDHVFPISDQVQCYNKTTNQWYAPGEDGLAATVAFSDSLTAYYDRLPQQGGKIRLVVAE